MFKRKPRLKWHGHQRLYILNAEQYIIITTRCENQAQAVRLTCLWAELHLNADSLSPLVEN